MIFFEAILYDGTRLPLLEYHYERIIELAKFYLVQFEYNYRDFETYLLDQVHSPVEQKIRLELEVHSDMLKIIHVETIPIHENSFQKYPAVKLVTYPDYKKPILSEGRWKMDNPRIYVDSMKYAQNRQAAQSLILNTRHEIVETSLSNFFYILKGIIFAIPIEDGAVNGVYRRFLMTNHPIRERSLPFQELAYLDGCFITSAVRGIVPVFSLDHLHFDTRLVEEFRAKVNKELT